MIRPSYFSHLRQGNRSCQQQPVKLLLPAPSGAAIPMPFPRNPEEAMTPFLVVGALLTPAQLTCPFPVHQAGRVATGTPITHSFTVRNAGRAAVELLRVKAACGCLQTSLPVNWLYPGEQTVLKVSVNTVTQPGGAGTWRATVYYRHKGEERELPLAVQATLVPVLTIRPAALRFTVSGPMQGRFTLVEHHELPVTITAVAA